MESPPPLKEKSRNTKFDKDNGLNDATTGTKSTESETIDTENHPKTSSVPEATVVHLNTESS